MIISKGIAKMTRLNYPATLQENRTEFTQLNPPPTPDRRTQINNQASVDNILEQISEEPQREGRIKTPEREARMISELTAGYHVDPERMLNGKLSMMSW